MRLITAYIHRLNNCKGNRLIIFLIAVSCLSLKAQKVTTGPVIGAGVSWYTDEALFDSLHLYPNKPTFAYNFALAFGLQTLQSSGCKHRCCL
ncbi:MAG: hypothetical protein IPO21_18045 [Bacteroidales bacterium]|nr:hypothetical protein [Bacteroidales bacterium]